MQQKLRTSWVSNAILFPYTNNGDALQYKNVILLYCNRKSFCGNKILTSTVVVLILLTHSGRVTHKCVSKFTITGSDNGLLPARRQAIIWTNAGILLIRPSGTNFSEILIEIYVFSFKKMHLKMSSAKCRPFCLGLNVLRHLSGCTVVQENFFLKREV